MYLNKNVRVSTLRSTATKFIFHVPREQQQNVKKGPKILQSSLQQLIYSRFYSSAFRLLKAWLKYNSHVVLQVKACTQC